MQVVRETTVQAVKEATENLTKRLEQVQVKQAAIIAGFPDSDPYTHRRYHESVMEWRELRNNMVREALIQAAKVGGLGAIGWVAYAVWQVIKMEIMK